MLHHKLHKNKLTLYALSLLHPQHATLGLSVILVSTILICSNHYYFYPSFMEEFLNDNAIGVLGLVLGVNLILWAARDKDSIKTNFWLLAFSCMFWAFEACAGFVQGFVVGSPYMIVAGSLEVIMFIFTLSIIGKSKKLR